MADGNGIRREGLYYYAPHRRAWGVWRAGKVINGTQISDFIADFPLKAQAESFVYKMNNWKYPKRKEQEDE